MQDTISGVATTKANIIFELSQQSLLRLPRFACKPIILVNSMEAAGRSAFQAVACKLTLLSDLFQFLWIATRERGFKVCLFSWPVVQHLRTSRESSKTQSIALVSARLGLETQQVDGKDDTEHVSLLLYIFVLPRCHLRSEIVVATLQDVNHIDPPTKSDLSTPHDGFTMDIRRSKPERPPRKLQREPDNARPERDKRYGAS